MTYQTENTAFDQAMELLIQNGFNDIAEPIGILLNAAMRIERSHFLKAAPYERTEQRQGYANGFKQKTINSRIGSIQLDVPQTRDFSIFTRGRSRMR